MQQHSQLLNFDTNWMATENLIFFAALLVQNHVSLISIRCSYIQFPRKVMAEVIASGRSTRDDKDDDGEVYSMTCEVDRVERCGGEKKAGQENGR